MARPTEMTPWQLEVKTIKDELATLNKRRSKLETRLQRLTAGGPTKVIAELRRDALLPNEKVTRRNGQKLEVMGRILFVLKHRDRRLGMTSAELFKLVQLGAQDLSFDTFRSYLSRFKAEGRLTHDQQHKLWNLATEGNDSVENN